jgi:hypothetical protein
MFYYYDYDLFEGKFFSSLGSICSQMFELFVFKVSSNKLFSQLKGLKTSFCACQTNFLDTTTTMLPFFLCLVQRSIQELYIVNLVVKAKSYDDFKARRWEFASKFVKKTHPGKFKTRKTDVKNNKNFKGYRKWFEEFIESQEGK